MSLFQASVLKKYLSVLNKDEVSAAYQKYKLYFQNKDIQKNIRESKEEQFQEGFLRELFVNILGYIINPSPDFNLTTELKNLKGAKKADGAILKDGQAVGVIELKSTKTKDLESIRQQAFDYKANHESCKYVVTSNFEKLRFYIDNAVDYEDFDLFYLDIHRFELLYFCLSCKSILSGTPAKAKQDSLVAEETVTKQLYKDYSAFKHDLYGDIVDRNIPVGLSEDESKIWKKSLFKKTQKLLDRFLFVFFAEDRGLLDPNTISREVGNWERLKDLDEYRPLYERYKKLFDHINRGLESKDYQIFEFNGGLFREDSVLDNLVIDDDVLKRHTMKLTAYDFETEVDVNILGHIFEHSLGDIEAVHAELDGVEKDKKKSRRKKEGVYYTPKYITQYIVENTVGALCSEKKKELEIVEDEYVPGLRKNVLKSLLEKLDQYRSWLLELTILDPACGSGAFLIQALDFLIREHKTLDEMKARLYGEDTLVLPEVENTILEKNIYGVDINDEAVDIAKLSLWLHTAKKGRKLSKLSDNIKCGNSLIDDPAVAGDKAFIWEKEFPHVFAKGGFDVVIGNPPYVRQEFLVYSKEYLEKEYHCYTGKSDIYLYFFERGLRNLINGGYLGYISSGTMTKADFAVNFREWFPSIARLVKSINFGDNQPFQDAEIGNPTISIAKRTTAPTICKSYYMLENIPQSIESALEKEGINCGESLYQSKEWVFQGDKITSLFQKALDISLPLSQAIPSFMYYGVKTGRNDVFVVDELQKDYLVSRHESSAELLKPLLRGEDLRPWYAKESNKYLVFSRKGVDIERYPAIYEHLCQFRDVLEPCPKGHKGKWHGRKAGSYRWYELQDTIDYYSRFDKPKIVWPEFGKLPRFSWEEAGKYTTNKVYLMDVDSPWILGLLQSRVIWFCISQIATPLHIRGGLWRFQCFRQFISRLPVPKTTREDRLVLERLALNATEIANGRKILDSEVRHRISTDLGTIQNQMSKKLEFWWLLSFSEFRKEVKKTFNTDILIKERAEWESTFEAWRKEHDRYTRAIIDVEKELNDHVFHLYGYTKDNIDRLEEHMQENKIFYQLGEV